MAKSKKADSSEAEDDHKTAFMDLVRALNELVDISDEKKLRANPLNSMMVIIKAVDAFTKLVEKLEQSGIADSDNIVVPDEVVLAMSHKARFLALMGVPDATRKLIEKIK